MVETTETRWQRHVDNGRRYVSQGDYAQAEQSLLAAVKEALTLGPADLRVASSLGILGKLKHRQGERERAQAFLERALAVREEALGRDHYGVVQGLNDLASLHYAYGQLTEARTFFERALAIADKQLAPDHGDIALALYNLSRVYFKSGDHLRAEPLLARLLDLKKRALGEEHTDVAAILTALSRVRSMAGRHDEAEEMARRALAIREKALPADDTAIGISLELVAYFCAGRAKRMRSLADAERILGGGNGASHGGAPDSTAGDTLEAQLALLAAEERALRERARDIRSRSSERREPTTLERSPEPVEASHPSESSTVLTVAAPVTGPLVSAAPAVHDTTVAEAAPNPTHIVERVQEAEVARGSAYSTQEAEVADSSTLSSEDSAAEAPAAPAVTDSWRVWQGPTSMHSWQESANGGDAPVTQSADDVGEREATNASEVVGSVEQMPEPEKPQASEDQRAAPALDEQQTPVIGAASEAYRPWTAAADSPAADSPAADSPTVAREATTVTDESEHFDPAMDVTRASSFAALRGFTQGRRGRWVIGLAALALAAAGGAGFAMGRGARAPVATPLAALQESSRGMIEEPQAGSLQSADRGGEAHLSAQAPPPRVAVPKAAPAPIRRRSRSASRDPRLPSQLQARRMTRTMDRVGSKVMKGVEVKVDSIGRSLELPPPKFGQP